MSNQPKIAAFSILELAVVLSLTGLFISLFFLSINSFNKTLQREIAIKNELNTFFQFRANFWLDMEKSDSFHLDKDKLTCFQPADFVMYSITDGKLSRVHRDHQTLFEIGATGIQKAEQDQSDLIEFRLDWKNTAFSLFYPYQKQNHNQINTYFERKLWKN